MSGPKGRPNARGMYYEPKEVVEVAGVRVARRDDGAVDFYVGTAEALIAAGLATCGMFPGQPGMPATCASFRPAGVTKAKGEYWHRVPGFISISRTLGGSTFRIVRTVSVEELARRKAIAERRTQERKWAQEARLREAHQQQDLKARRNHFVDSDPEFRTANIRFKAAAARGNPSALDAASRTLIDAIKSAGNRFDARAGRSHLRLVWSRP